MENTVTSVWIDPSWLSWERHIAHFHSLEDTSPRLYEAHQHACDRLAGNPNEFDRVDAITTLRHVVGRRVKTLKEIYQLRELPIGVKPKGDLELLSSLGIIRQFMLMRLIDIRNIAEHENSSPPSADECLMFTDLVWYFLRSTDGLVKSKVEHLVFLESGISPRDMLNDKAPRTWLFFREPLSEPPEIISWLDPDAVAYEPRIDWIRIDARKVAPQDYYFKGDEYVKETQAIWMHLMGEIRGTDEQMRLIYKQYFKPARFL